MYKGKKVDLRCQHSLVGNMASASTSHLSFDIVRMAWEAATPNRHTDLAAICLCLDASRDDFRWQVPTLASYVVLGEGAHYQLKGTLMEGHP